MSACTPLTEASDPSQPALRDRFNSLQARLAEVLPSIEAQRVRTEQVLERSARLAAEYHARAQSRRRVSRDRETQAELDAAREKIGNLEIALTTARRIGMAIGIVMSELKLTESRAFEALVAVSQSRHERVRDIAEEIVLTGTIHAPRD
jgi:ABC-type transporter Mla subunit MlaD